MSSSFVSSSHATGITVRCHWLQPGEWVIKVLDHHSLYVADDDMREFAMMAARDELKLLLAALDKAIDGDNR